MEQKTYYTIYQVTNQLNGKIYIGKHQTVKPNDGYYGSGRAILDAIKKYGKHNFTKEVLFVFDSEEEMNAKERELITEEFVGRSDTYNLGVGGEGGPHFKGRKHSEETLALIKERSHRPLTPEGLQSIKDHHKRTNASRGAKTSAALKGRPKSEEHKAKIREAALRKAAERKANGAVAQ